MTTTGTRRPYLSRERRLRALLVAAAEIVETRGWNALTMVSLAEHAGVSRQLVYQHFESLQQVIGATLQYIFEDVFVRTRDEVAQRRDGDIKETVAALQQITFDIPVGRARALWQAMSASGSGNSEMAGFSRKIRHLLVRTTQPLFEIGLGIPPEQAAPLTWMLMVSFWGARQLVDDGELSREDAVQLYSWMVDRVVFASRDKPSALTSTVQPAKKASARGTKPAARSKAGAKTAGAGRRSRK